MSKTYIKETRVYFDILPTSMREAVRLIPREEQKEEEIEYPCYLFLDQSTKSGYALFDSKKRLILSGLVEKKSGCGVQNYKYAFKEILEGIIEEYKVCNVFYEEVYDKENMQTTEVLMYIKHMIQDMGYENQKVEVLGVDHAVWKSHLAKPEKFSPKKSEGKKADKNEVKRHVGNTYPLIFIDSKYGVVNEDMTDAIGMGIGVHIKSTLKGSFYGVARYNKKLPIHQMLLDKDDEDRWEDIINHLNKPYRSAYEVGGVIELEVNKRKGTGDLFKQVLSHRDCVVVMKIPYEYKDWGVTLLLNGKSPAELGEDKSFWMVAVRKNRK